MRILFVTLAAYGHIAPTLALVEELTRRGHQIAYATGAENAESVTAAGAEWVELPQLQPFRPTGGDMLAGWFRHYFAAMRATYPVLFDRCRTDRPDVVCYDATNWPARLVAGKLGIRTVRCVPHFASNEHFTLIEPESAKGLAEDCARFSAEHEVHLDVAGTLDSPDEVNLVFLPRELQPAGDTFDDSFHFIGPLLGSRESASWSPRHPDLPLLYVSAGSIMADPAVYRACVAAFGDGTWQVAMNARGVGPVPSTFEVRDWFPQLPVLRHAKAFVTHAGMNSTVEALYYGVPLVMVPLTPEQAINADRVHELGLGERLDDIGDLRAAVERVASSAAIRENLDRMRAAIQASGGAGRGAGLVSG